MAQFIQHLTSLRYEDGAVRPGEAGREGGLAKTLDSDTDGPERSQISGSMLLLGSRLRARLAAGP